MSPTRRDVMKFIDGAAAATVLPADAAAAEPAHPRWNTVLPDLAPDDDPLHQPVVWMASGFLFAHGMNQPNDRQTVREMIVSAHADGSMRIAFCSPDPMAHLSTGRDHWAIQLAPDLAQAVWLGAFAAGVDDPMPTTKQPRAPWDHEQYIRNQQRRLRMYRYRDTERAHGADVAAKAPVGRSDAA